MSLASSAICKHFHIWFFLLPHLVAVASVAVVAVVCAAGSSFYFRLVVVALVLPAGQTLLIRRKAENGNGEKSVREKGEGERQHVRTGQIKGYKRKRGSRGEKVFILAL